MSNNRTLIDVLKEVAEDKGQTEEVQQQALSLVDDISKIIAHLASSGFPMEKIEINTVELEDGGLDIYFCMDGFEIPEGVTYEQFQELVKNVEAQEQCPS